MLEPAHRTRWRSKELVRDRLVDARQRVVERLAGHEAKVVGLVRGRALEPDRALVLFEEFAHARRAEGADDRHRDLPAALSALQLALLSDGVNQLTHRVEDRVRLVYDGKAR